MPSKSSDVLPAGLTSQQVVASGSREKRLFINAGPGTGKTTVAAQRFGALRFLPEDRSDHRAVTAVSFTRAATWNLQQRVKRIWGRAALTWPHRIVTLDTIMSDLLHDLLSSGLLRWPNGHTTLTVVDSWNTFSQSEHIKDAYEVQVDYGHVRFKQVELDRAMRVPPPVIEKLIVGGVCTHQDVRDALEAALEDSSVVDRVRTRWAQTTRALIVDEVFDANDLDIAVIELAVQAGLSVTLVGDPWQALYVFRGARPEVIPQLLSRTGTRTIVLTDSFRWRDSGQQRLAEDLRAGRPVSLDSATPDAAASRADVVLAVTWKQLWTTSGRILPLAFHSFKGGAEEAAATLLLNHVTRTVLGQPATYLADALLALGISDPDAPDLLHDDLQRVLDLLRPGGKEATNNAYALLADVVKGVSSRSLRRAHHSHTNRLRDIGSALTGDGPPVLGLTTHQAKGREWDTVGVTLTQVEQNRLLTGLSYAEETDRKLYVACTRARRQTLLIKL
ncbi:UvrD-helicase domain-containing protein [Streptoalloteichus hindustanus]|uniref:DNA 3'-5' helicase n=1 Tax=Streptoalloteichus hindustanus TaxID=2017 RepID=A0A1M5I6K3_STRHI|nr:UvrD-helicase domain-containing protein [Streptoalloteichus hindustanus]SHG23832.1 DNA helicase-2 / ATP-dependent DNA helicase PcrA [Streptoalloteichus hindustanus]